MKNARTPRLSDLIRQPAPVRPAAGRPEGAPAGAPPHPQASATVDLEPERASEPARPAAVQPIGPPVIELTEAELEARRDYELLETWLGQLFEAARLDVLDCPEIFETVRALLERPRVLDALFAETFRTKRREGDLPRKSVNVTIYALRLGKSLDLTPEALETLGAAAMLHKIGLARIPDEILLKAGTLGRRERVTLQQHPGIARDLIRPLGPAFDRVAAVVFQAHERGDGSGYPQSLHERDICREAQIIGLADVFEALIQARSYRERLIPFAAAKTLLQRDRARFPRAILRELIASFSVFPPFTYVRLNSRAVARVEETEPGFPLRPKVTIVLDANGARAPQGQTLRLRETPLLYITGPVSEEELPA